MSSFTERKADLTILYAHAHLADIRLRDADKALNEVLSTISRMEEQLEAEEEAEKLGVQSVA